MPDMPEIGVKLTIDGEKEFKSAITDINAKMKTLGTEAQLLAEKYKGNESSIEALTAKQKILNAQFDAQKSKLETSRAALEAANKRYENAGQSLENYKKQLADAQKELDRMKASGTASNEEIAKQEKTVASLAKKVEQSEKGYKSAGRQIEAWKQKVNTAETELVKLDRELADNDKALYDSEHAFEDNAKSVSKTSSAWDKLRGKLDTLKGKFQQNAEKSKGAVSGVEKFGKAAATAAKALVAGALIKKAGELATKFIDVAKGAAEAADNIKTLSTNTGLSTDFIQKYQYSAQLLDVDLETLTGSMARNIRSMASAQKGTAAYADAYNKLGVKVTDANGKLRNSETVYWELIDALGKVDDDTERDAISMQLFGRSAQDLNSLIKAGSGAVRSYAEEAEKMGTVLSGKALDALGDYDDSIQRLKGTQEGLKNQFGAAMAPALTKWTNALTKATSKAIPLAIKAGEKLGDVFEDGLFEIQKFSSDAGDFIEKSGIKDNLQRIGKDGESAFKKLKKGFDDIKKPAGEIIEKVTKFAADSRLLETGGNLIGIVGNLTAAGVKLVDKVLDPLFEFVEPTLKAAADFSGFLEAITSEAGLDDPLLRLSDEQRELAENISDSAEKMEYYKKTSDEASESAKNQYTRVESLAAELQNLADKSGKVKDSDKERAAFILGELNKALGTEYTMTGDVIDKYGELTQEVDKLIAAKTAAALIDAHTDEYVNALEEQVEATKNLESASADYQKQLDMENALLQNKKVYEQQLTDAEFEQRKIQTELQKDISAEREAQLQSLLEESSLRAEVARGMITQVEREIASQQELTAATKTTYDSAKETLDGYTQTVKTYEEAQGAYLAGNAEKVKDIFFGTADAAGQSAAVIEQNVEVANGAIVTLPQVASDAAADAKAGFENNIEGFTFPMVSEAESGEKKAVQAVAPMPGEFGKVGADAGSRLAEGIGDKAPAALASGKNLASSAKSGAESVSLYSSGANTVQGFIDGLNSKLKSVRSVANSIAEAARAAVATKLDEHSPSRVMMKLGGYASEGFAIGMESKLDAIKKAGARAAGTAEKAMQTTVNNTYGGAVNVAFNQSFSGNYTARTGAQMYRDFDRKLGAAIGRRRYAPDKLRR